MRFAVSSGSGQVLAQGELFLQPDEGGELSLCFRTDRGTIIQGGKVGIEGDLAIASQTLYRQFFLTWGVMGITLTSQGK